MRQGNRLAVTLGFLAPSLIDNIDESDIVLRFVVDYLMIYGCGLVGQYVEGIEEHGLGASRNSTPTLNACV